MVLLGPHLDHLRFFHSSYGAYSPLVTVLSPSPLFVSDVLCSLKKSHVLIAVNFSWVFEPLLGIYFCDGGGMDLLQK